ncbi:MAG: hypothetical protein IJV67_07880 [Clostridia bacterium]|nr:hypothetical protein [Clostridia bacterium]
MYGDEIENFGDRFGIVANFQYGLDLKEKPDWRICQWASRFPFHDIYNTLHKSNYRFYDLGGGKYVYDNVSKTVGIDTEIGQLDLTLRASACYKKPRVAGQEWPHLLVERDIGEVGKPSDLTRLNTMDKLTVNMDVRINDYKDCMGDEANWDLHAIIFIFYLQIANFNPESGMFDDMIWFGLPVWDNRWAFTPLQSFPDSGTKDSATDKWIYNIPTETFFSKENNLYTPEGEKIIGEWKNINLDILPIAKKAFLEAQNNGYMVNSKFENLCINGMYFGFESCGTYDAAISIKNFDIIKETL